MLIYVLFHRKITGCIVHCAHTIKSRKPSPRAPYPLVYCIELTQKNVWQKISPVLHSLPTHTIACHLFGNSMQSWLGNRFLNFNLCSESKIYQTVIIEKRRVILWKKICTRTTSPFIKKYTSLGGVYRAYFFFCCVCVGFNLFWSNFSSMTTNMVSHKLESLCLNMMQLAQQQHNS